MAGNQVATLTNGVQTFSDPTLVGMTVDDVFNDDLFSQALSLSGGETVEVNGNAVSRSFVIRANDTVRFTSGGGTKGSVSR